MRDDIHVGGDLKIEAEGKGFTAIASFSRDDAIDMATMDCLGIPIIRGACHSMVVKAQFFANR